MALDHSTYGQSMDKLVQDQYARGKDILPPSEMCNLFPMEYYKYSLGGEVEGVLVSAGGAKSELEYKWESDNTTDIYAKMASSICSYWDTVVTPGPAAVLDVVLSVTPDAFSQYNAIYEAIRKYSNNEGNGWVGWMKVVEDEVKKIPFVVVEMNTVTSVSVSFTRFLT